MQKIPADQAEREVIARDLDTTILVEAAAGTGKTTSLVTRMVNLVRTGRASAREIAAITFTRKAGAQLRERFQEELERAIAEGGAASESSGGTRNEERGTENAERRTKKGESRRPSGESGQGLLFGGEGTNVPPPAGAGADPLAREEIERLRTALTQLDRAFLGTTHAFCARLLRERPVEAGLDPEFRELDEQEARIDAAEFWSRWWELETTSGDPVVIEARRAGLGAAKLAAAFHRILYHPDVRLAWKQVDPPDLAGAMRRLDELLDAMAPLVPEPRTDGKGEAFEQTVRDLLKRRASMDPTDVTDQLRLLREANHASRRPVQMLWRDKGRAKQFGEDYRAFVENVLRPTLDRWRAYVHGVALSIVVPAAEAYAEERREQGKVTFEDLLVRARDLLRDQPEVRRYFQARWRRVLVDEFQDTDPVQAEILFYLTGEDTEERRWRKLVPRPGSLFIVGDPKQSIYRFRRADITTYLTVRERIEACGGKVVVLSTNFRSTPAICSFVNESFGTLFAAAAVEEGRQAAHVDLVAHRDPAPAGGVFKLVTPAQSEARDNDLVCEQEAECIASWIRTAVEQRAPVADGPEERPAAWGDFLLVSWQRPRLTTYAKALERAGVPYEITGGKAFQESEELARLLPLLRAILDPDDAIPLVAFLRGPLCGVDDDALYRFRKLGGRMTWRLDAPEGADGRIVAGLALVRDAAKEAESLPAAAVIARLVDRLGLAALASAKERGETRAGNLALALTYARKASGEGSSLAEVVELLDALREETSEIEELSIEPAVSNAVRLMNLHQVKGLEAPFVFLIDPTPPYVFPVDIVVDRGEEESVGHVALRAKPWPGARFEEVIGQPDGWNALEEREKKFKDAETMRLLYVAATRARQWLVVGSRRILSGAETGAWSALFGWIGEELERREPSGTRPAAPRPAADAAAARSEIEAHYAASAAESYSVLPITKLAHENHERLVRAEEGLGRGTSWGRVMHRLFEAMLKNPSTDVSLLARNLLKDEEREPAELETVLRTVEAVRSSPLWKRATASDQVLVEVPFAIEVPAAELGLTGPANTLLHGTVDLLFREAETWSVIDYKTDSTAGRLDALVEHYAPQVRHYARFWSRITGAPTRAGLFFVDGCRVEWVAEPASLT
ncbi:MAG TPA: UvrD-helicase domain-containing protein [Thermoanaerobaculia bacterium]|nr:UvrD-helicase domain-containing protein [Thermoanaerobaculia bacterium]